MFKKLLSDMRSSGLCIYTQIIYEKRCKGYHIVGKRLLSYLTECISHAYIVIICRNIYRLCIVLYHICKLFICIFCRSRDKNIRSDIGMDLKHLL